VCGHASATYTAIWFTDYPGHRAPIRVSYGDTANTRMWPEGSTPLSLGGSTPTLHLRTRHTMTCPACGSCTGSVYFAFKDSITTALPVRTATPASVATAIESLSDLTNMNWPSFDVEVVGPSAGTTICRSASSTTFTIDLISTIGNIPSLTLMDSSLRSSTLDVPMNISFVTNTGDSDVSYECSNQGICDRTRGICRCNEYYSNGKFDFRGMSSDGYGSAGNRGDCGFLDITTDNCPKVGAKAEKFCNGHGYCQAANSSCLCADGWNGYACQVATCPKGRAWFDEAISTTEAHQAAECSNMGMCDRSTGLCLCAEGYSGEACQYLDCPYNLTTGAQCGGAGWCMSIREFSIASGFAYGVSQDSRAYPDTWDADMFHHCLCAAYTTGNIFTGNKLYPPVTTNAMVSGRPGSTRNLMGWKGWDCGQRLCPIGPKVSSRALSGTLEVQRIVCIAPTSTSFTLSFNNGLFTSKQITGSMGASQIKDAIEWMPSIGNISVEFRNSHLDSITTACNPAVNAAKGGFFVTFLTDFGDLPAFTPSTGLVTVIQNATGTVVGNNYPRTPSLNPDPIATSWFFCYRWPRSVGASLPVTAIGRQVIGLLIHVFRPSFSLFYVVCLLSAALPLLIAQCKCFSPFSSSNGTNYPGTHT
jgi:hypothetical protein